MLTFAADLNQVLQMKASSTTGMRTRTFRLHGLITTRNSKNGRTEWPSVIHPLVKTTRNFPSKTNTANTVIQSQISMRIHLISNVFQMILCIKDSITFLIPVCMLQKRTEGEIWRMIPQIHHHRLWIQNILLLNYVKTLQVFLLMGRRLLPKTPNKKEAKKSIKLKTLLNLGVGTTFTLILTIKQLSQKILKKPVHRLAFGQFWLKCSTRTSNFKMLNWALLI